jgi:hypothetical protein
MTMKETTSGRRGMRAMMASREKNVAAPGTRARIVLTPKGPELVSPARRKTRDAGTAMWNAELTEPERVLPRRLRRSRLAWHRKPESDRAHARVLREGVKHALGYGSRVPRHFKARADR